MSFANMGVDNLFQQGFNALQFSLMGMMLVFSGLIIIAVYIIILPKLLNGKKKEKKEAATTEPAAATDDQSEIVLAVACALHLHRSMPGGSDRITITHDQDVDNPWQVAGRMNSLGMRKPLPPWRKK